MTLHERRLILEAAYRVAWETSASHRRKKKRIARKLAKQNPIGFNARQLIELWERDEGVCWICGGAVVHPRSPVKHVYYMPTRDHIIPKSKGGPNKMSNYKLAHNFCNSRRGNRDAEEIRLFEVQNQLPKM